MTEFQKEWTLTRSAKRDLAQVEIVVVILERLLTDDGTLKRKPVNAMNEP